MKPFENRLKELRLDKKISQKQLAEIVGTNNSSICDWECGRSEPNLEALKKIAIYFEVSADYLIGLEKEDGSRITNEEIEYFKVKRSLK